MFFTVSKLLRFFALPSNLIFLVGLIGWLLLLVRRRRAGTALMGACVLLLAVAGLSPLGSLLLLPLEQRFPAWDESSPAPDGILVLGGAIDPEVSTLRGTAALNESAERMTAAVALARRYPRARLVFSGGNGNLVLGQRTEAEFALTLFGDLGLPRERIELEARSRNTAENARFSKDLIAPKPGERWLLVTSAFHMPRAVGAFRAVGFPVEPYPVDWRVPAPRYAMVPLNSVADGLKRTDTALREWIGLVAYRLTGRSSALFPAPE